MPDDAEPADNQAPAPTKPKLSPQQQKDIKWIVAFVASIGLILLVTVALLMRVLRRRLREMESNRKVKDEMPDIWLAGGRRLTEQMSKAGEARDKVDPFSEDEHDGDEGGDDKDGDKPRPSRR